MLADAKHWTEAPLAASHPRNDFALLEKLDGNNAINYTVAKAALAKMVNHLWYLSEELVALSLYDTQVICPYEPEDHLNDKRD